MKKVAFLLLLAACIPVFAQEISLDDLMDDISIGEEPVSLLPDRMLFTQRAFWGEKGLYRRIGWAPKVLTAESRQKELKVRRTMFRIHQATGLLTAGMMLAQGILGAKLYNGNHDLRNAHENMATAINIGYATTALMSLTAPPAMVNRKKFDNIKLHKILALIHFSGMIATNVLAHKVEDNPDLKKYHKIAGISTFAAYTAAIVSIKFEF